ncbi:uncharacterized protein LOC117176961 [Belonocnema kinseyi]|uniref:uncharacterized protein LOC117176961 n=1 Tax=Belonocnema kinseyi TaxID=2817044 RepID=UPI00143CF198|nr:uncharacterized protein LOC117176961 [Belonocnema kinseyi]
MSQSKSTIPLLMRLKEIDEKYKLKKYQEERPSSASTGSFTDDFRNNVKNHSISGSGDTRENQKQKILIKMPDTQMEPNIRMKSPNGDLESSTVVVTIVDKSATNSNRTDTYLTSKITIDTRSGNGEMGPGGEGNIITNVDVSLQELESDKSASLSSISEAIDSEIKTLEESHDDAKDSNGNAVNLEITSKKTDFSQNFRRADLPVYDDVYRYSDDTFEDVSSYSESVATLKFEIRNPLKVVSPDTNSDAILSSPKFQKNKSSSTPTGKYSNISEKCIEHASLKEVKPLSEFESSHSNELSRCVKITRKLEIANSDDFTQYSLKYATTSKSREEQTCIADENKTSSKLKRSNRILEVEQSINSVSYETDNEGNSKIIEHSVKNNYVQNKINHESELIQLYVNKSSGEKDFENSESVSSIAIQNEKRKDKSTGKTLKNLSKVSGEIQKESRRERKSQNSMSRDSSYKVDDLKMHEFHEKLGRKSISKAGPRTNLSENVDLTPIRIKEEFQPSHDSNNKTECKSGSKKRSTTIKFRKIPSKIPEQFQVKKNNVRTSCRCSFILEEEKQQFYQTKQQATKPIIFKPLDFPNISGFMQTDVLVGEDVQANNLVLRQRLFEIRSWLKDQFNLYRNYCKVVSAINQEYVPSSLLDVKKQAELQYLWTRLNCQD